MQRPGIGESIAIDMLLLRKLMGVVDVNFPQFSQPLVPLVDEFAARLFGELDYVVVRDKRRRRPVVMQRGISRWESRCMMTR